MQSSDEFVARDGAIFCLHTLPIGLNIYKTRGGKEERNAPGTTAPNLVGLTNTVLQNGSNQMAIPFLKSLEEPKFLIGDNLV